MSTCRNCPNALKRGGARGLCPRCWKYEQRTGHLPTAPPRAVGRPAREPGQLTAELKARVEPELLVKLEAIAKQRGINVRELVRRVLRAYADTWK